MTTYNTSDGWVNEGLCKKCGKPFIYIGDVPEGGFIKGSEPYCTCNKNNHLTKAYSGSQLNFNWNNQGWTCPKCGKVFAPHINECIYCNSVSIGSVWSTDTFSDTTNTYRSGCPLSIDKNYWGGSIIDHVDDWDKFI